MKKRIIAVMLVLLMVLSMLPVMPASIKAADTTIFDRFIPVNQAYSASVDYAFGIAESSSAFLSIGTQFRDETVYTTPITEELKRSEMQGKFFKLNYKGTFGTLSKEDMMEYFDLSEKSYQWIMEGPNAEPDPYNKKWITKDSIIISIDLYDADKNFVRTISPATAIMATGPDGEFATFSVRRGYESSIYFSKQDNLFKGTDDKPNSRYIHFEITHTWLEDKSVADGLLGSKESEEEKTEYKFIQHPKLEGTPQYMTNNIISVNEFIAPDNTYYQVGRKKGEIDPCVMNKIENVVDYSREVAGVSSGATRRTILTADGKLYGVSSNYEKEELASGVKQVGTRHYLTNQGEVKEIESGKTISTDCKAFAEHRYGRVIGVLKNDDSFAMGYTYLGEKRYYEQGPIFAKKDNVKQIVPGGVITKDNTFYRWVEQIKMGQGVTTDPETGAFQQSYTLNLKLEYITDKAVRVFPYEYYTGAKEEFNSQTGATETAKTGFVENDKGKIWGFGLQSRLDLGVYEKDGTKSLIRRILPVYQSEKSKIFDNGNFVGFLPEERNNPSILVSNHCTNQRPVVSNCKTNYITDVPGGFRAMDGYAYAFDNDADDGTPIRNFKKKRTAFHYLDDGNEMFMTINTSAGKDEPSYMRLLPNVARSSFNMDNKSGNTVLLERTDGSMWMTELYPVASAATTVAKLGGWECSNAIQVTEATKKKVATEDYIDLVSREEMENYFPDIKKATPIELDAPNYIDSKYYSQLIAAKTDQLSREKDKFLLLVTKADCSYSKKMKSTIKNILEKEKVPIYGCVNDYSSLEFVWKYTKKDELQTPYFVLVNGDKNVTITECVRSEAIASKVIKDAKKLGLTNDKSMSSDTEKPTVEPTKEPTTEPTKEPTTEPTKKPTVEPTKKPVKEPGKYPYKYPAKKISVDCKEWEVLRLVNQKRFAKKLPLLTMPNALQTACNTREVELASVFSSTRPNGTKADTAISKAFKHKYTAENIAKGQDTSAKVVKEWTNGKGQRANMLNKKFTYLGVGYNNTTSPYWVQMFTDGAVYKSITTSTGKMKFKSVKAMQKEYLICKDKNGVKSYLPLDTHVMTKKGNKYTLKLKGKKVTLTVTKK